MVDTLTKLGNDLAPVEQELQSARDENRAMKSGWLIGSASRMKKGLTKKKDSTLRHHITYTFDNRLGSKEYPLAYKPYLQVTLDVNLSFGDNGSIKKRQEVRLSSKARFNF